MDSTSPCIGGERRTNSATINAHLQNEEPVVIQIDSATFEKRLYFAVVAPATVDGILAAVVSECCTRHDELGVRDNLKIVGSRLE